MTDYELQVFGFVIAPLVLLGAGGLVFAVTALADRRTDDGGRVSVAVSSGSQSRNLFGVAMAGIGASAAAFVLVLMVAGTSTLIDLSKSLITVTKSLLH